MNAPDPAPAGASPALAAFLRGIGRRALLFAEIQSGDAGTAGEALADALPRFLGQAARHPMAQWPVRFWAALLASPALHGPAVTDHRAQAAAFAPLRAIGNGPRAALLLWLVAGLEEEEAAAALGVDPGTWRLALQRAAPRDSGGGIDGDAWQALSADVNEALRQLPQARLEAWERQCRAALASGAGAALPLAPPARARWLLPLLWAGVAACALALAATFPPLSGLLRPGPGATGPDSGAVHVRRAPLRELEPPRATFDADFALRTHPDLAQLAAGGEAWLRELEFHAWHAAQRTTQADASLPLSPGGAPDPDALSAAQTTVLRERIAAWDALTPAERGARRERWQAWQRWPAAQRGAVQDAVAAFAALPPEAQQALRMRFAQLPQEQRRGWLLGPVAGAAWPRLQPLLMQVPAAQREPLLATLHELSPLQLDDLATLAQRTPPQDRDDLRRELLSTAEANRTAWLRERLQR